jgi:hypothetical protein
MRMISFALALLMVCAPRAEAACAASLDSAAEQLASQYDELPIWSGVQAGEQLLLTVFAAPDGRSWTLIATEAGGASCEIAAGVWWVTPAPAPKGEDG